MKKTVASIIVFVFTVCLTLASLEVKIVRPHSSLANDVYAEEQILEAQSPVPAEAIDPVPEITPEQIAEAEEPDSVTFEEPAYNAETIIKDKEEEEAYRASVNYVENTIVFSVLDYRKKGEKADYLKDSSKLCKKYDLSKVEFTFESKTIEVEQKEGLIAYQVFYTATIKTKNVWNKVDEMEQDKMFLSVEPDFIWENAAEDDMEEISPEDLEEELAYSNWESHGIDCPEIWGRLTEGTAPAEGVVVAVIDTGVDYNHHDLKDNMWTNPEEIPNNGRDDDGNGYVDDIHGINLIDSRKQGDPMDDHGHGTHVAGIIGMTAGNGGGVGIAYGAKIMAIKAGDSHGSFSSTTITKAIQYAVANGADVINMSFGGKEKSLVVENALIDASSSSILVAAAGNNGYPTNDADGYSLTEDHYPSGYSCVLGVMASTSNGQALASFSNWDYRNDFGCDYEMIAPGENILSTLPNNRYARWSGTSMATPIAAAEAAILRREWTDKNKYNTKYIMGQMVSGPTLTYIDKQEQAHVYNKADIVSAFEVSPVPHLILNETVFIDSTSIDENNNGDGVIQAGETIDLGFVIKNKYGVAKDIGLSVEADTTTESFIEFETNQIQLDKEIGAFSSINTGFVYDNDALIGFEHPIRFRVSSDAPNDLCTELTIHLTAQNGMNDDDHNIYDANNTYSFLVQKGHYLRGTLREDKTLTNDQLWIIDRGLLIEEGVTVNVDPGTKIQFYSDDSGNVVNIRSKGTLNFNGTAIDPIEILPNITHLKYAIDIAVANNGIINFNYTYIANPVITATSIDHCVVHQTEPHIVYDSGSDAQMEVTADLCEYTRFLELHESYGSWTGLNFNTLDSSLVYDSLAGISGKPIEMRNTVALHKQYHNYRFRIIPGKSSSASLLNQNAFLSCFKRDGYSYLTSLYTETDINACDNFWGTTNENVIEKYIYDNLDDSQLPTVDYGTPLATNDEMSSIYPFVTEAYITDEAGENRLPVVSGSQNVQIHVKFNRDMAQETIYKPIVTYGTSAPYSDYEVNGNWVSAREWVGSCKIVPFINQGINYLSIKDAVADDDHWLITETDSGRFSFEINKTSAESMILQGNGGSNNNYLNWIQDDYETLAGYNLYRSTSYNKDIAIDQQNFIRVNDRLLPNDECEYIDTAVSQGQDYYYYFTVVDTDFNESEPSNVVMCTPIDEESPVITTRAIGTKTVGEQVTVAADITDNVEVTGAKLFYKMSDAENWIEVIMRKTTGNTYQGVISGYDVKKGTMQYYIAAEDGTNTSYAGTAENPNVFSVIDKVDVTAVTLDQTSLNLTIGDHSKLTASVYPEDATDKTITWSSSNEQIVTVDDDGNIEAIGVGEATVMATSADGNQSAICNVAVAPILVEEVVLVPEEKEVYVGDTFSIEAEISPENATDKSLEWESLNPDIVEIDSDGNVTAVDVGEADIIAVTVDGSNIEAVCHVVVYPIAVKAISLSPTSVTMNIGQEAIVTASVYPLNATNKTIDWTSDNPDVAIVEDGKITALSGGVATITAKTEDGGFCAICNVRVNLIPATNIILDNDELSIDKGTSQTLHVTKTPENASLDTYDWKSDDKTIASVKDGVVTGVTPGKTFIYCTTQDGSDITKVCEVKVYGKKEKPSAPVVTSKSLTTVTLKRVEGALYSNGGQEWTNDNVFTGLTEDTEYAFYIKLQEEGYYRESDPSEATIVRTDESLIQVTGIEIDPADAELMLGESFQLEAIIEPEGALEDVKWSSSNEGVATVTEDGMVNTKAIGRAFITCRTEDGSNKTAIGIIRVYDQYPIPEMPEVVNIEENSIELESIEGLEYRIGDGQWGDQSVFSDLDADTEYMISVKKPDSGYHKASEEATTTIKTSGHTEEILPAKPATCTESGLTEGKKCSVCGKTLVAQEEIPALGHSFGEWETVTSPNCTDKGSIARTCSVCGLTETDELKENGHDWENEYTIDQQNTCTTDGSESLHCKNCDAVKDSHVIPATGHAVEILPAKPATCTEAGLTEGRQCSVCGETLTAQTVIPALGHSFGAWETVVSPTCTNKGSFARTCSICGLTETEEIKENGHFWKDEYTVDQEATCTTDGSESIHCKNCDAVKDSHVIPATGHAVEILPAKPATCTEAGLSEGKQCSVCGETLTAQTVIPALGHSFGAWETVVSPTCTNKGSFARTCSICGLIETEEIKENGHSWKDEYTVDQEATCTTDGNESIHCKNCDAVKDSHVIPATGHTFTDWTQVIAATCTKSGKATRNCTTCNEEETMVLPAIGHDWGAPIYTWADDNSSVTAARICEHNANHVEDETVATTRIVIVEPTETTAGTERYTSNAFENEAFVVQTKDVGLPPIGYKVTYDWVETQTGYTVTGKAVPNAQGAETITEIVEADYAVTIEPSCTSKGAGIWTATFSKSQFSAQYKEIEIAASGHDWGDWKVTIKPTTTQEGEETRTCVRCSAAETRPIPIITEIGVTRIYGSGRYETAFLVADELKEKLGVDEFKAVILADGRNYPDALAGSYLSSQFEAPILLVNNSHITAVQKYIRENMSEEGTIYILGGTGAVPDDVMTGMDDYTFERLAGASRYETNIEILNAGPDNDEIVVCTGKDYADSLSASAVGRPILLVKGEALQDCQKAYLESLEGQKTFCIIGGEGAVTKDVENALKDYGTVKRIFGASRYDTSVAVAEEFFPDADAAVLAYGQNFPDGLCGGALAYYINGADGAGAPLILTRDSKAQIAAAFTSEKDIKSGAVLGGTALISDESVRAVFQMEDSDEIEVITDKE